MSTIADALVSLGVSGYSLIGEPTTEEEFKAAFTGTTDKTWAEIKAEKERIAYKDKRKAEYPSIEDQLDDIYHNGVAAWKTTIKAIKDKYPKPS
jgi:hypothetical protein